MKNVFLVRKNKDKDYSSYGHCLVNKKSTEEFLWEYLRLPATKKWNERSIIRILKNQGKLIKINKSDYKKVQKYLPSSCRQEDTFKEVLNDWICYLKVD